MRKAVLVDLDGTLLTPPICLPQAACITEAITRVFAIDAGIGPEDVPEELQIDWTGQTDFTVMTGILENAGLYPEGEMVVEWQNTYEALFRDRCPTNLRGQVRLGMEMALARLQTDYTLRVVTGNTPYVAQMKLERAGVLDLFDIEGSAFATPGRRKRPELVAAAMRGHKWGVLVGDTWRDMKAARQAGILGIGIQTERQSKKALHRAGAVRVIEDYAGTISTVIDELHTEALEEA